MLFKNLLFSNNDYTVIFEDDLTINVNDLDEKINNILNNIDINVDFIFLGTQSRYFGKCYKNNLFYIHERAKIWGFQGYIINNKNITKILNNIQNITCEIDIKIFSLIKQKKLFGLFVNPSYINQNIALESNIRPSKIKLKDLLTILKNNCTLNDKKYTLKRVLKNNNDKRALH
jgi:GR25 family glycosyltransferase involved in LPS biosynthesis